MWRIAVASEKGMRPAMEDAHAVRQYLYQEGDIFAGVYDGHSGQYAAFYAADTLHVYFVAALKAGLDPEQALGQAYQKVSQDLQTEISGTTAVNFYLQGQKLTVAHAGDCRALIVSRNSFRQLTEDHRVDNPGERARIKAHGGIISGAYVMCAGAGLMPTRTLGDSGFEAAGVTAEPEVSTELIARDDLWLLAASDGLFDVLDNMEVARLIRGAEDPEQAVHLLSQEALINRMGTDNLTVIVLGLNK